MIKSVTTCNTKDEKRNIRHVSAEVTIEGNGLEIMHEFLGILESMEKQCPEILIKALQRHTEGK